MTSLVLGDLILESLTPSVNAPLVLYLFVCNQSSLPGGLQIQIIGPTDQHTEGCCCWWWWWCCCLLVVLSPHASFIEQNVR